MTAESRGESLDKAALILLVLLIVLAIVAVIIVIIFNARKSKQSPRTLKIAHKDMRTQP